MNDLSYTNWVSMSDNALIGIIGAFVKFHRLNQNKTQKEVSDAAGISRSTLSLLERGEIVLLSTVIQVLRVLDLLYIMNVFKIQEQKSPIELAKLEQQKRQRASNKKTSDKPESDW